LQQQLATLGLPLVIRIGNALETLLRLMAETGAESVYWNRRYEPYAIARDAAVKSALHQKGIAAQSFNGTLLFEPWTIANKQNKPFQVFTPFWRCCLAQPSPEPPLSTPQGHFSSIQVHSEPLSKLELLPRIHWDAGLQEEWQPGAAGAQKRLEEFVKAPILEYLVQRDRPDLHGTSKLSPHLRFGELSPRMIWHAVLKKHKKTQEMAGVEGYLRQLGWREFAYHLLYHFPHTVDKPLRPEFAAFPWKQDKAFLKAWQKGMTGYPIVDAGMRELWHTGWMHNRARMVVGSFLVKDLLLPWQEGEKWFWDTLVDADMANNVLGWQWVGGCGADAAPYFRIFNPITQGEKFDPAGAYVRRWVPELAQLPDAWVHKPWMAPEAILLKAHIRLGQTYPRPIVDHAIARQEALAAFSAIKQN
jgi:deoxyribodipyrimidine photo-lyase